MLIESSSVWPPQGHWSMRTRWLSWWAWWGGDTQQLKTHTTCTAPGGYWARRQAKPGSREIHLPLAGDIARTSAELVAGDTPTMTFEDDDLAQKAWDDISQRLGWSNSLLEAAETASALGGVYLRPAWDETLAKHPLLTVVRADEALPEFKFGILRSVTFVQELAPRAGWKTQRGDAEVWRHLEHHEPGQIRNELWLGTSTSVGRPLPLAEHPVTAEFPGVIDTSAIRPDGLLVDYIPNDLPQPLDRLPLGRSDYQGVETLLDALDEAWDSWMRDIRLGKARILASKEMLNPVTVTQSRRNFFGTEKTTPAKVFDEDAEVFTALDIPAEDGGKVTPITSIQFAIRYQEHQATCAELVEQITSRAGYSPQTMGMHVDGQLSGTAMRRREQRSYRTRDRKRRYARPALERCSETLMLINQNKFAGPKPKATPTLGWRETDQADPQETAATIELLRRAQVLSTEIAVQMAHPEWDPDQVKEEVGRLATEQQALTAPPLTGFEPTPPPAQPGQQAPDQTAINQPQG